ncbi:MAG TPA: glycosyltransferase family 2 protein [Lacibacter sp.]|nr:glycosyltransferase family 2 protein [Lacibacter sp.]HMO89103.1 glycosyltransferase family 2 protein [Lacibacter sp.]
MSAPPHVAVVLLNWNGRTFLEQFMPSVLAATYGNYTVYLADNASTDDSVAWVQEQYPVVHILQSPQNLGYAGGYNFFLRQVEADYYVLLNSDIEVQPDWLAPLVALLEQDHHIAACQPKILSWHKRGSFEYAGAAGGWIDALGYPFSRGRVFDTVETDTGQYDEAAPVFWASGAAFFVRAAVFHEMGGFDESFFAHQEEIDLCWRMQRLGYRVYACPQSVVYHVGGGTLPAGSPRKVYLNFRNNLVMLVKNMPLSELLWKLPIRMALDALSAWKELLQGKPAYWRAVFQAHLDFADWWLRASGKYQAPHPSLSGWYSGSVVWQYFVKRRRHFSQIVHRK